MKRQRGGRAIFPGSFDPITNGHLDIIERALCVFDEVIVAVLINAAKQPLFTAEERVALIKRSCRGRRRVRVDTFSGLLVEYAVAQSAGVIVRGLRAISDFEYEFQMALMNRRLNPEIETVFMMPAEKYSYVSSRIVKEVSRLGGELSGLVPALVQQKMHRKFRPTSTRGRDPGP